MACLDEVNSWNYTRWYDQELGLYYVSCNLPGRYIWKKTASSGPRMPSSTQLEYWMRIIELKRIYTINRREELPLKNLTRGWNKLKQKPGLREVENISIRHPCARCRLFPVEDVNWSIRPRSRIFDPRETNFKLVKTNFHKRKCNWHVTGNFFQTFTR